MRILSALFLALSTNAALSQDASWSFGPIFGGPYIAAVVCPLDGNNVAGNAICLAVGCVPGTAPSLRILAVGGDLPDGTAPVAFFIDGQPMGSVAMSRIDPPGPGTMMLDAPLDPAVHGALLARLQGGTRGGFNTWSATPQGAFGFTLRGSSRAISNALASCAPLAAAAPVAPVAPPVAGALTADEVRATLLGPFVIHTTPFGEDSRVYLPNGRFEGQRMVDGRGMANNGTYRLEPDGRICWSFHGTTGCFRYYRTADGLRVKREDAQSGADLGSVTVIAR